MTQCPECQGTGAYMPDCWLCKGSRDVLMSEALEEGYVEEDLDFIDDGYVVCPVYGCHGEICSLCHGDGEVLEYEIDHEITRVLVYGLEERLPPRITNHYGRRYHTYDFLARFAGKYCRDKGWIYWFVSVFGDEISLTKEGMAEAKARRWGWYAGLDSTTCPYDDAGRWCDDGGAQ